MLRPFVAFLTFSVAGSATIAVPGTPAIIITLTTLFTTTTSTAIYDLYAS